MIMGGPFGGKVLNSELNSKSYKISETLNTRVLEFVLCTRIIERKSMKRQIEEGSRERKARAAAVL